MAKLILTQLLFLLFFCNNSAAQDFIPFGQFSPGEIDMKQCSFDTEADAVVLLHEAYADYNDAYHLITRHHVRIKILKDRGLSNANISIRYWKDGDFEKIFVSNAATFNFPPDGMPTNTAVERKTIFKRVINERVGEVVFSFPNVKAGSILEYEYESDMNNYNGLDDWYFQEERPVVKSKFSLKILPNAEFTYNVNRRADIPVIVNPLEGGVYFEMNNIPGLRNEAFMDARKDYLQKVVFQLSGYNRGDGFGKTKYMTSWDELAKELMSNSAFGGAIGKKVPGTEPFIQQALLIKDSVERMKTVYSFVKSNITWNRFYSRYASDGLKTAWQKKTGTSGEINFILINLLKDAGLNVFPALVSHRFHGTVTAAYPFVDQFSSVVACVKVAGTRFFLDATEQYTPPHIIPNDLLNTTALILSKRSGELTPIANEFLSYGETIVNTLEVNADGSMKGEVSVNSENYARIEKVESVTLDKDQFKKQHFQNEKIPIKMLEFEVEHVDDDALPLTQNGTFTAQLTTTGDYYLVPLNLFSGFNSNPFISKQRFSNINFGYRRVVAVITKVNLPAEMVVDDLPKSIKLVNPEKDIVMTRMTEYKKETNRIETYIKIEFLKSLYEAADYDILKEMYTRIIDVANEPVLVKKK